MQKVQRESHSQHVRADIAHKHERIEAERMQHHDGATHDRDSKYGGAHNFTQRHRSSIFSHRTKRRYDIRRRIPERQEGDTHDIITQPPSCGHGRQVGAEKVARDESQHTEQSQQPYSE